MFGDFTDWLSSEILFCPPEALEDPTAEWYKAATEVSQHQEAQLALFITVSLLLCLEIFYLGKLLSACILLWYFPSKTSVILYLNNILAFIIVYNSQ